MIRRVPQPPLNPALRGREQHDFWAGFVVVLIGLLLVVCGAKHLTAVETSDGGTASETQLVKALSFGGLQFPEQVAPPPPPRSGDPAALVQWAQKNPAPKWKVRVDTAAAAPCPT
jgi:hypothetical protein